ncbi:MAG: hypothetical protein R6U36_09690 [Candidatus Fermentibacteraceae bacterium]
MIRSALTLLMAVGLPAGSDAAGRDVVPYGPPDGPAFWADSGHMYTVTVEYPQVAYEVPAIGDTLVEFARGFLEPFFGRLGEVDGSPVPWEMEIRFRREPSPDGLVCLMAHIYAYEGGAHGMNWSSSWVYSRREGFIDPVSMLGDSADFAAFAAAVRDTLLDRLDSDSSWIVEGTLPEPSNYKALLPLPDSGRGVRGFRVDFSPYQVAPYVFGAPQVIVRDWPGAER